MTEKPVDKRISWPLLMMLALSLGPLILAVYFFQNPENLSGRTNYGHLIQPSVPVERSRLSGFDAFSKQNIGELRGRWVLVHIVTSSGCKRVCMDSLHKTKQVRLMLNKDLMRVRRLALIAALDNDAEKSWDGHDYLLRSKLTEQLIDIARNAVGEPIPEGVVFLMDPIGNIMMWYEPGFDPYGMKKDLKKLLYVSRVGQGFATLLFE